MAAPSRRRTHKVDLGLGSPASMDGVIQGCLKMFVWVMLVFIGLTFSKLLLEELFPDGHHAAPLDDADASAPRLPRGPPGDYFKAATVYRDAGLLHSALRCFDEVILATRNSTADADQILHLEAQMHKGTLLLVLVSQRLHLDPAGDELDLGLTYAGVRVGHADSRRGDPVFERIEDDVLALEHNSGPPGYALINAEQLVNTAVTALSKAVRPGVLLRQGLEQSSFNLGMAVLVSQLTPIAGSEGVRGEAKLVEVVTTVLTSLHGFETLSLTVTHLMNGLTRVLATGGDKRAALEAELRKNGFLGKLRGLDRFLAAARARAAAARGTGPVDPVWRALTADDTHTLPERPPGLTPAASSALPRGPRAPPLTVFQKLAYVMPEQSTVPVDHAAETYVVGTVAVREGAGGAWGAPDGACAGEDGHAVEGG